MATVAILGTCDTKGAELSFLRDRIREGGADALLIDYGLRPPAGVEPDTNASDVAAAVGEKLEGLLEQRGREAALSVMCRGLARLLRENLEKGAIHAVVALGGSVGTSVAGAVMQELPLGFPKLIVSTVLTGGVKAGTVGIKDVSLMATVVDLLGLNRMTRAILDNAAAAIAGMALACERRGNSLALSAPGGSTVAVSCLGVITPGAIALEKELGSRGFEVIVFHVPYLSGTVLSEITKPEELAGEIRLAGTELMLELLTGNLATDEDLARGPERTDGPALLLAPGGMDMLVMPSELAVEEAYRKRKKIQHTEDVTLVQTTLEESRELGRVTARLANAHPGPVGVAVPLEGFSIYDRPGEAFHDEKGRGAFLEALLDSAQPRVRVERVKAHINDTEFARSAAGLFADLASKRGPSA